MPLLETLPYAIVSVFKFLPDDRACFLVQGEGPKPLFQTVERVFGVNDVFLFLFFSLLLAFFLLLFRGLCSLNGLLVKNFLAVGCQVRRFDQLRNFLKNADLLDFFLLLGHTDAGRIQVKVAKDVLSRILERLLDLCSCQNLVVEQSAQAIL